MGKVPLTSAQIDHVAIAARVDMRTVRRVCEGEPLITKARRRVWDVLEREQMLPRQKRAPSVGQRVLDYLERIEELYAKPSS